MPIQRLEQILEQGAGQRPHAVAVVCGKARATYLELHLASNAVAARLLDAGVAPGDRVGLYLAKGVASVVALFAVLKTGAAYVPLDPTGPLSRSLAIAGQGGVKLLLVGAPQLRKLAAAPQQQLAQAGLQRVMVLQDSAPPAGVELPELPELQVEALDLPAAVAAAVACSPGPAGLSGTADDTAYILYTSGSTGAPKGVTISHHSALYFVRWAVGYVGLTEQDRCSNHAPLFFDLSVFDIFATLLAGGAVIIVPPAYSAFPRSLANYVEQQRVSVWYSVPSTLIDLLQVPDLAQRDLSALRVVIFAGEVFPMGPLRALMQTLPGRAFFNLYGPTETNVCTAHRLEQTPPQDARQIPIGRVCQGLDSVLLDQLDNEVQGAGEGELLIAGPAVMQGYFGLPEQSAAVITELSGRRYYRTGDLVRRQADGLLYFVGRKDQMVKVGGYRVEPGEVEAALDRLPGVAEGCAVALSDADGRSQLTACLVPRADQQLDMAALRAELQQRLPKYMIPQQLVQLASLPRTATGKIDRKGLAEQLKANS